MIKQCGLFLAAGLLAGTQSGAQAATDPFLEQNGRLVVETESGSSAGGWSVEDSIQGYTGTGYLVWRGINNYAKPEAVRGNPISYHFTITTPGNYELRWRSRNTVGLDATEHNDGWVRFPTGRNIEGEHFLDGWTKAYMGQVAQWTWDVYTVDNDNKPIRQFFDAGEHVVDISGRSNGHGIDRFALFRYDVEGFDIAQFEAMPQSPTVSQAMMPAHSYTGNSCVANVITTSANTVFSNVPADYSGQSEQRIIVNGASGYALLKFDLPSALNDITTVLKLAGSGNSTRPVSVYLGSHSNWNASTAANDMPYPSLLLGTLQGTSLSDGIASLEIDSTMLSGDSVTLMLATESDEVVSLYGNGTRLDPRLDVPVSQTLCDDYNLRKSGPFDPDTTDEAVDSVEEPDASEPDDLDANETPDVTDANTDDNGESAEEISGETTDESNSSSGNSNTDAGDDNNSASDVSGEEQASGNDAAQNSTDQNVNTSSIAANDDSEKSNSWFGGASSLWTLLLLAGFTQLTRASRKGVQH